MEVRSFEIIFAKFYPWNKSCFQDLDSIMPAAKMLRLGSTDSQSEASASLMFVGNNSNSAASPEEAPSAAPTVKEPLKTALQNLFEV